MHFHLHELYGLERLLEDTGLVGVLCALSLKNKDMGHNDVICEIRWMQW